MIDHALRLACRPFVAALLAVSTACTAAPSQPDSEVGAVSSSPITQARYELGAFPELPSGPLPDDLAEALQDVLDEKAEEGVFPGR